MRSLSPVSPVRVSHFAKDGRCACVAPREREVLRRLALGLSNRDIADALCISEETVKTHVGSVLGKLQVENRAQAIVQALRRGLVTLEELT